jgi:hypothetical protein
MSTCQKACGQKPESWQLNTKIAQRSAALFNGRGLPYSMAKACLIPHQILAKDCLIQ